MTPIHPGYQTQLAISNKLASPNRMPEWAEFHMHDAFNTPDDQVPGDCQNRAPSGGAPGFEDG